MPMLCCYLFTCTDTLVLDPVPVVLPTLTNVLVLVELEVVKADGSSLNYQINVPNGTSLLETLTLLQQQQANFKSVSFI